MAHTLKLDIYCFSIKRLKKPKATHATFGDFFSDVFCEEDEDPVLVGNKEFQRRFIEGFLNEFKDEFVLNEDETKGLASQDFHLFPKKNKIDGFIKGGQTGIDQDIYDRGHASKAEEKIPKSKITALPYYFKLWMPNDGTVGVLMMQSYTNNGVNGLFIKQLKKFVNNKEYSFVKFKHVPEEYKEKFKKKSKIHEVTFIKQKLGHDSRESLNAAFTEHEGLKVTLKFGNINESPASFLSKFNKSKYLNADLSALEMVDEDDYETVVAYKDEFGHRSSARVSKNIDILPTYFLPDELKQDGFEFPEYEKIRKHTDMILKKVKEEIEYTPVDVD